MAWEETVQITMPQMGESVSEGTVLTWHKQEGDGSRRTRRWSRSRPTRSTRRSPRPPRASWSRSSFGEDEVVDGRPAAGRDRGRAPAADGAGPGATVGADRSAQPAAGAGAAGRGGAQLRPRPTRAARSVPDDAKISPVARRVAAAHGIDLSAVGGSGTGGRIVKEDVLAYIERNGGGDGAAARARRPSAAARRGSPARSRCAAATRCSLAT